MVSLLVLVSLLPAGEQSYEEFIKDARMRRAMREKMVQKVGSVARNLVETYGECAVVALDACQPATGQKLAACFNASGMQKWPRPKDLLVVISKPNHRDDVALFVIEHQRELEDIDTFEAFLADPLVLTMGLKPLAQATLEMKTKRFQGMEVEAAVAEALRKKAAGESRSIRLPDFSQWNWKEHQHLIIIGVVLLVFFFVAFGRRGGNSKVQP